MPETPEQSGIYINGEKFVMSDLNYAERRQWRDKVRELAPDGDADQAGEEDIIPAFVWIIQRRTNPTYSIEDALALKPGDLEPKAAEVETNGRPTEALVETAAA